MQAELVPVTLHLPAGDAPRSEGIHVSRVIAKIAGEAGILKPQYVEDLELVEVSGAGEAWWDRLGPAAQLRMAIGLAWELWYAQVLAERMGVVFHPGECCVDGIYMTPDGEAIDILLTEEGLYKNAVLCLHEIKATYKSLKTVGSDLASQWLWLTQLKAYCKAKATRIAFIHVLFLCGDYTYPITPQLLCWRIEFTEAEIDDSWEMIVSFVQYQREIQRALEESNATE